MLCVLHFILYHLTHLESVFCLSRLDLARPGRVTLQNKTAPCGNSWIFGKVLITTVGIVSTRVCGLCRGNIKDAFGTQRLP